MFNVLLFKALTEGDESGGDQYMKSLIENFPVKVWPISVLKFVFEDPSILGQQLEKEDDYNAIILTREY
jgi:hypothetical protein